MIKRLNVMMSVVALTAGAWILAGCEADESLPTPPRASAPLAPDKNGQDNAEKRVLESPQRQMPTAGKEFPGQSRGEPVEGRGIVTLQASPGGTAVDSAAAPAAEPAAMPAAAAPTGADAGSTSGGDWKFLGIAGFSGPTGWNAIGHTTGPTTEYNRYSYPGPMPELPANPGSVPMKGSFLIPGADWSIDNSWGQGVVLQDYPHRAWPTSTAYYQSGAVKHDPIYYFHIQEHLNVAQSNGSMGDDWISNAYEIPWFYVNTALLPVLMVLEPPLAQRTTSLTSADPNFRGHLPEAGAAVPLPTYGTVRWEYPFMNPDGSMKDASQMGPMTLPSLERAKNTVPSAAVPVDTAPATQGQ